MGSLTTESKPWLNNKGLLISDVKLKKISQNWDQNTWEEYLSYIESPRTESIIRDDHYNSLAEIHSMYGNSDESNNQQKEILLALKKLTKKQQKIIFLIFWEGFSSREIATRMNISSAAVQKIKNRALNSLKEQIEGVNALRIMRGKNSKPFMKRGESHEQQSYQNATAQAS